MVENIPISLCYIYLSNNNVVFLYSNTENFPICLLSLLQRKDRQKDEDADDGHHQTANRACRQRKPETFLARADHERDEAEDGGNHRQEDGDDFRVPRLDEGTDLPLLTSSWLKSFLASFITVTSFNCEGRTVSTPSFSAFSAFFSEQAPSVTNARHQSMCYFIAIIFNVSSI